MFGILFFIATLACAPATNLGMRFFSIPSAAMEPTLPVGSTAVAYRCAYGLGRYSYDWFDLPVAGRWPPGLLPRWGDVVILRLPRDPTTFYIKRVIGLPGDTVQMKEGRLYINGEVVAREPAGTYRVEDASGKPVDVPRYREVLPGGATHDIIERDGDTGFYDNTALFEVPPGSYFVMGDNRDNSVDSRMPASSGGVGFVPGENLFGQVVAVGRGPPWPLALP